MRIINHTNADVLLLINMVYIACSLIMYRDNICIPVMIHRTIISLIPMYGLTYSLRRYEL